MAGTPVSLDSFSVASPAVSEYSFGRKRTSSEQERELQATMQDMISLQYQTQELLLSSTDDGETDFDGYNDDEEYDGGVGGSAARRTGPTGSAPSLSPSLPRATPSRVRTTRSHSSGLIDNDELVQAPHPSIREMPSTESPSNDVVGKGTIIFSTNLRRAMGLSSSIGTGPSTSSSPMLPQLASSTVPSFSSPPRPPPASSSQTEPTMPGSLSVSREQPSLGVPQPQGQHNVGTPSMSNSSKKRMAPVHVDAGSTETAGGTGGIVSGLSRSKPVQQQLAGPTDQVSTQMPQHMYAGYGSIQDQNRMHTFHYGSSGSKNVGDYGGSLDVASMSHRRRSEGGGDNGNDNDDDDDDNLKGLLLHDLYHSDINNNSGSNNNLSWSSSFRARNACCNFCNRICCLWAPLVQVLSQENLNRSFCYGSIDGLLTGSGLVAALMGLGVLHNGASDRTRLAVVALVTAACIADSLAMAMGHVWNTYFVVSHHAEERTQERLLLESNKAEAKSKLVDLLLSRAGMLKIDAMSLADALEGYPDLFVSALVGDSLLSADERDGGFNVVDDEETEDGAGSALESQNAYGPPKGYEDSAEQGTGGSSFGSWRFPSYGQLREDFMHFDTPEASNVNVLFRESRKEGCFMMMGFALFAVVPSLLWFVIPMLFSPTTSVGSDDKSHPLGQHGQSVSVSSIVMFTLAMIVWLLGVWKSKFVDSNWAVFGVESVAVLFVCVLSAYGAAAVFVYCMTSSNTHEEGTSHDDDGLRRSVLGLSDL